MALVSKAELEDTEDHRGKSMQRGMQSLNNSLDTLKTFMNPTLSHTHTDIL